MDPTAFRVALDRYRRPSGHSQQELARVLGLHPHVLSHKLHGSDGATLRHDEVREVVRVLASWGALQTRVQAVALLALMGLGPNSFSPSEWDAAPLVALEAAAEPHTAQRATVRTQTVGPTPRAWLPPAELTPLIGREALVEHVLELLRGNARLVTLTGTGGTGKTRLALAVAAAFSQTQTQCSAAAVHVVALAAIRDAELVADAVAAELGLRESTGAGRSIEAVLLEHLRTQQLLLVLDNLEQVLGAAPLIADVLRSAPGVRVLATSRVSLRLYGEHEVRVPPLSLPRPGASEQAILASEAVTLFVQRARAARADFQPDAAEAELLRDICARLDGLPLAIELAAARIRHLSLPVLRERLGRRLSVLNRGPRDAPDRQRTLRATLDWSYALLPADRQRLFERLGVFAGGCTTEAVQAVCVEGGDDAEDGLWELVDNALLEAHQGSDTDGLVAAEPRFGMLETVREYALARLAASSEMETIADRHRDWCLAFAEQVEPEWLDPVHVARLEREQDNVRAALRWSIEHGELTRGLRLAISGGHPFWYLRGRYAEGRAWLNELLALGAAADQPGLRAAGLIWAGQLAHSEGATREAEDLLHQALHLAESVADARAVANVEHILGNAKRGQGNLDEATQHYLRARTVACEAGRRATESWVLLTLMLTCIDQGDVDGVRGFLAEFDDQIAVTDNPTARAWRPLFSGWLASLDGDHADARLLLEDGLKATDDLGYRQAYVSARRLAAYAALDRKDWTEAARHLNDMLAVARATNDRRALARALDAVGELLAANGQVQQGLRLAGTASALHETLGGRTPPIDAARRKRWMEHARLALGADAEAALAAGRNRQLVEAVDDALLTCRVLLERRTMTPGGKAQFAASR